MKSKNASSGIMLYAKSSGITSFSSLWSIKHALGTDKVGHTGTLDSFADGLLVVLSGNLTHLVPHVTAFTKTYEAIVCFGKETDTLDPTGEIVKESSFVSKSQIENVLSKFTGAILQTPPSFSALHVNGKRASDLVREGKEVFLESRQIFIYEIKLCDYFDNHLVDNCSYAKLKITCSKGTYIRALARDIAYSLGSCAHLCALRRIQVGPFSIEDAACYNLLEEFTIKSGIEKENKIRFEKQNKSLIEKAEEKIFKNKKEKKLHEKDSDEKIADIKSHFINFSYDVASLCGFECYVLKTEFENYYKNGRPLKLNMFEHIENIIPLKDFYVQNEIAIFYSDGFFAGIIKKQNEYLGYSFVVPHVKKDMKIFSWKEICDGAFPIQWKKKGSAITIGSFEAIHKGHQKLLDIVLNEKNKFSGVVTFSSSISQSDNRNIWTLEQRLNYFKNYGIDFVILIEFNSDFAKLTGESFFNILLEKCNLQFLAEGKDFKCGYKGSCNMESIVNLSQKLNFNLTIVDYVEYEGEKVSSTIIKNKIFSGNFKDVQFMLGRDFEVDLKEQKFEKKSELEELSIFESVYLEKQILPKDSTYNVVAIFVDKTSLHTKLIIKENKIMIFLPTQKYADSLLSLYFY